jgi:integration host factor subunit alpha
MDNQTVTRAYLMEGIHKKLGYSRAEAGEIIDAMLEEINKGLQREKEVKISSFGTFQVRMKNPRIGRNPKTKKEAAIHARNVVSFYASNLLKRRINGTH